MNIFKKKYELFRITEGNTAFCLTSANKFITHNNEVYEPATIDRSSIQLKFEMEKQNVTVSLGLDNKVAQRYLTTFVETQVGLTLFENYDGDTQVIWKGRLVSVGVDGSTVKLKFENGSTLRKRSGAYRRYQRTCPHALYGKSCGLNQADFAKQVVVSSVAGNTVTAYSLTAFDANYFSGGMIENGSALMRYLTANTASVLDSQKATIKTTVSKAWDDASKTLTTTTQVDTTYPNTSTTHVSSQSAVLANKPADADLATTITQNTADLYQIKLTLFNTFTAGDLVENSQIQVYPGCDKSNKTCGDKYNNILNFGGFPFMPNNNPFVGTII